MPPDQVAEIAKEISHLAPLADAYQQIQQLRVYTAELKGMADASGQDAELVALAQEELADHRRQMLQLQQQLLTLLVPRDAADEANAIVEVRAGTSPAQWLLSRSCVRCADKTAGGRPVRASHRRAGGGRRAGTGGSEAAVFARELTRMYERYASVNGWRYELLGASVDEAAQGFRVKSTQTRTAKNLFAPAAHCEG